LSAADTNLCAVVQDYTTGSLLTSGVTSYTVATPISSTVNNDENKVSVGGGQSAILTVYPSGGAPPYTYQWYADPANPVVGPVTVACVSGNAIGGATSATYATPSLTGASPPNQYHYAVAVTDSVISSPGQSDCEQVTVFVYPTFSGTFVVDNAGAEIDQQLGSGAESAIITFAGGVGPWYSVTIYSGTDSLCTGDTTKVASLNDINGTEAILSFPEPSTSSSITYYCAVLSDMSSVPEPLTLGPVQLQVSPALSAPVMTIAPSAYDYGTTPPTVKATVTWAGGVAPYFVFLVAGSQKACATEYGTPVVSTASDYTGPLTNIAGYLPYYVFETHGSEMTFSFTAPSSSTYYCAIVTDSSYRLPR